MKIAVLQSHPIQYYAPILRALAHRADIHVYFAHMPTAEEQAVGFGNAFTWDVDLLAGYPSTALTNKAKQPSLDRFSGTDTPDIGQHLSAFQPDAVLTFGWYLKSFVQGILAAKRRGIPVAVRGDSVVHRRDPQGPRQMARQLAYPVLLRLFNAAFFVGTMSRQYYRRFGYPAARLFPAPHCVDTEFFAERATRQAGANLRERLGIGQDKRVLAFAGKLLPGKRAQDLVEAAAALSQKGIPVHVVMAGSGVCEEAIVAAAQQHCVPLSALGFCNQSEMPAVYAAANVLVLPSERETWGLVCNEALAAGVPVVVSDAVGCAPDLAIDGQSGAIYPMGDTAALANAIQRVLESPPRSEAIKAVSERHSIDAAVSGIVEGLEQSLG